MKWRLYKNQFHGSGQYKFESDTGEEMEFEVDEHGVFEFSGVATLPVYAFAAEVGGKRDRPY